MSRHAVPTALPPSARACALALVTVLAFGGLAAAGPGAKAAPTSDCASLGVGSVGPAVATVQQQFGTPADGDFGPMTRDAVRAWQGKHHVKVTGVVDAATWRALPAAVATKACGQPVHGSGVGVTCTTLSTDTTGIAVRVVQTALKVTVDGEYGPQTKSAVTAAQRRLKVPADGTVAASSWAALGLTGTPACITSNASPKAPGDSKQQDAVRQQVLKLSANLPSTPGTTDNPLAKKLLAFARAQSGKPYKFGAAGPTAYDCSGLVLAALQSAGITMPRVAADQYTVGRSVPLDQAQQGDLVFWASDLVKPSTIYHVGVYAGAGKVVDAPHTGAYVGTRSLWTQDLLPVVMRPTALPQLPVKPGASGWTVAQLQQALDRGGATLTVDGADGPMTTSALKSWQKAHKLRVTGVADMTTWLSFG